MTEQAEFDDYEEVSYLPDGRVWVTCWQCGGDGVSYHDCGDDTCCCLWPEDNVTCDICRGEGGWHRQETSEDSND